MARAALNIAIVAGLAALVVLIPGGGTGAHVAIQAVSVTFLASIAWVGVIMYREHRVSLYSLGERRRAVVYLAVGGLILTLTATGRLWHSTAGQLAWLALLLGEIYALAAVAFAARRY